MLEGGNAILLPSGTSTFHYERTFLLSGQQNLFITPNMKFLYFRDCAGIMCIIDVLVNAPQRSKLQVFY